jgi:NADPH:quinone reductase-like Zn-dependent oxidoreductase
MVIDVQADDFGEVVRAAGGADVVLDMIGGAYLQRNLTALNMDGRIVYIAALDGGVLEVPVMALMQKRATLTGSTLRNRPADEKARLARRIEEVVWPWIEAGRFRPMIDAVFPLADAAAAHARLEAGAHLGKIILTA